jgi:arylsulfatase A-like enzyme
MNRHLSLLLGVFFAVSCLSHTEARQPNFVLILADDLGPGDLGAYGQTKIKTANLDRMAAEGMKLTQHYCGNAVCAPSRSVLMTGALVWVFPGGFSF